MKLISHPNLTATILLLGVGLAQSQNRTLSTHRSGLRYPNAITTVQAVAAKQRADTSLTSPVALKRADDSLQAAAHLTGDIPDSLFDTIKKKSPVVTETIRVHDSASEPTTSSPIPFLAGGQEIITSAGTFGDMMRFLDTFPGVVPTSDISNDVLVRGGLPMENLYLVDGIEIPNMNIIATLGTTGGLAPMIDSALVQSIELHTGGYDARFPGRLSSITEVRLLDPQNRVGHAEMDFGIQGIGGLTERKFGIGDLLMSAHRGLLDAVTKNVGLDGVPTYTDELTRFEHSNETGDRFEILNVAGWDSITVTPCEADAAETNEISSQYSGWRETTGAKWQHIFSGRAYGVGTVSDSEQVEHLDQEDQFLAPTDAHYLHAICPIPEGEVHLYPVYLEHSNSAFSSGSYRIEWVGSQVAFSGGTEFWLQHPYYDIQQPAGAFSPYSAEPVRADNDSFSKQLSTLETGTFSEITVHPSRRLVVTAGGRVQTFEFGGHTTITPRISGRYRLFESVSLNAVYASYAQLPPYIYLVSYPQNRDMLPMRDTQEIVGLDVDRFRDTHFHVEAYLKEYSDTPASTEYPSVTLHDMADLLGEQFVWLPMNSAGRGRASGIEFSNITRIGSRVFFRGSVAYARAKFAGLDGVFRPSNFDLPWIINLTSTEQLGMGYTISSRFGFATGRPYTSYDLKDSLAQNRPIYNLRGINAFRAQAYSRLDFQISKDFSIGTLHFEFYGGVDNVLNRQNFLTYAWMPLMKGGSPLKELNQIPIFPNFGVRFIVH